MTDAVATQLGTDATRPIGSFDAEFDAIFAAAYRAAYRLLGERQDALECAQEALTRAYPHWDRLAQAGNPLPWVVRVSANLATDRWRQHKFASRNGSGYPTERHESAAADDGLVERLALHNALATLSRRQREVVVLRYIADFSEATVAKALKISTGSVKQHASRGLAALRLSLQE